jgi:oligoribonuclease
MAGNSIHQDKMFLAREFPKVIEYLHYRMVDVTSFKEVLKRHNPKLEKRVPRKTEQHTARADIVESIAELRWYMDNYLIGPQS